MNQFKGDQKHLTLSQHIKIEKGLLASLASFTFTEIARTIGKDPSTVLKEVRKHSEIKPQKD